MLFEPKVQVTIYCISILYSYVLYVYGCYHYVWQEMIYFSYLFMIFEKILKLVCLIVSTAKC